MLMPQQHTLIVQQLINVNNEEYVAITARCSHSQEDLIPFWSNYY